MIKIFKCPKCKNEIDHLTEHKDDFGDQRLVAVKDEKLIPYEEDDDRFWYADEPQFECPMCDEKIAFSYEELIRIAEAE